MFRKRIEASHGHDICHVSWHEYRWKVLAFPALCFDIFWLVLITENKSTSGRSQSCFVFSRPWPRTVLMSIVAKWPPPRARYTSLISHSGLFLMNGGFLSHRATPSYHHPFIDGNHPAVRVPPQFGESPRLNPLVFLVNPKEASPRCF